MADESSLRAARQKALAEKKRRLEEIKARRTNASAAAAVTSSTTTVVDDDGVDAAVQSSPSHSNKNLESYIDNLLKSSTPGLSLASVSAEEDQDVDQVPVTKETAALTAKATTVTASSSPSTTAAAEPAVATYGAAAEGAGVAAVVIQPRAVVVETFEVAIQCEEEDFPPPLLMNEDQDDDNENDADERDEGSSDDDNDNDEDENPAVGTNNKSSSSAITQTTSPDGNGENQNIIESSSASPEIMILSPEEKSKVLSSKPFTQFLSNASRRVERLLGSNDADVYGILKGSGWGQEGASLVNNNTGASDERGSANIDFSVDYANEDEEDNDEDGQYLHGNNSNDEEDYVDEEEVIDGVSSSSSGLLKRRRQKLRRSQGKKTEAYQIGGFFTARATYEFPKFTQGRNVTDIKWCPGHAEWVLASYNAVASGGGRGPTTGGGGGATVVDGDTGTIGVGGISWPRNNPTTRHLSPHDPSSSSLQKTSTSHRYTSTVPDEGIVAVYNLSMPSRPEHLFCAGCPILHSQFHPTEHPRLIVGGGSSGQVLVWDARAGRYPVQRSNASSGEGHNCELVGMKVLGDVGGNVSSAGGGSISTSKLVTASSDGKVNYWAVSNLREPVENVLVDANLSCLEVLHGDSANIESVVCGDERGGVHAIFPGTGRDGSSSNKRVIRTLHPGATMGSDPSVVEGVVDAVSAGAVDELTDMGHFGMVTSVSTRPTMPTHTTPRKRTTTSSKGFVRGVGGLMVTTGVDWSTKLWAPAYYDRPLMSYLSNSYDYMCDAQWSPVHPSIFATASSNGTLNIWNLASTLDQPVSGPDGIPIDSRAGGASVDSSSSAYHGLNRIQWSSDGRRLAVASGDKLHMLGVGEQIWKLKGDEESRVMHNLMSRGLIQQD